MVVLHDQACGGVRREGVGHAEEPRQSGQTLAHARDVEAHVHVPHLVAFPGVDAAAPKLGSARLSRLWHQAAWQAAQRPRASTVMACKLIAGGPGRGVEVGRRDALDLACFVAATADQKRRRVGLLAEATRHVSVQTLDPMRKSLAGKEIQGAVNGRRLGGRPVFAKLRDQVVSLHRPPGSEQQFKHTAARRRHAFVAALAAMIRGLERAFQRCAFKAVRRGMVVRAVLHGLSFGLSAEDRKDGLTRCYIITISDQLSACTLGI